MSTTLESTTSPPAPRTIDLSPKRGWRFGKNHLMTGLMGACLVVAIIPLVLVLWTVISKGAAIVFGSFPSWFTDEIPIRSREAGPGMAPAIVGTILITFAATVMAVPLGILGAVYLHEYGGRSWFSRLTRFMANVMTGVPSVVMGLFIYTAYTLRFGLDGFGGALALACLMLPVVIRSVEEMLRLVPDNLREGAYALGTRKSRTILTVVIPSALPGIVSGSLLAVARAAGETAPLIFTIGAATAVNTNLFDGANTALSTQIFVNATSSFPAAQERAWGAALTLVGITFLTTIIARALTRRFALGR
jgi:phosphate transport system permease protein